jgi:hypothetical protein
MKTTIRWTLYLVLLFPLFSGMQCCSRSVSIVSNKPLGECTLANACTTDESRYLARVGGAFLLFTVAGLWAASKTRKAQ